MKTILTLMGWIALSAALGFSQGVGIGDASFTPAASSVLELRSTDQGILVPRMTGTQRAAISSPATGLLVYETTPSSGFWYYDGDSWETMIADSSHTTTRLLSLPIAGRGIGVTKTTTVVFGNAIAEQFDIGDELYFSEIAPTDYAGGDIYIHVDFLAMGTESGKNVRWTCSYKADDHQTPASGTTGTVDTGLLTLPSTQYLEEEVLIHIPASQLVGAHSLHFKLTRIDTGNSTDPITNPAINHVSITYPAFR